MGSKSLEFLCDTTRLSGRNEPNVRILWVRSASLIKTTRISRVIAKIILRKFSTCASWRVRNFNLSSFDTRQQFRLR